jgi:two-component system nitrate/nitrite response regulator NarL
MRILVVDDHPLVRKGIILVLSGDEKIEEIYESANIEEGISLLKQKEPDIAIVDLKLDNHENGMDLIERAKKFNKKTKFLILTSYLSVDNFDRAEKLGVDGYIFKDAIDEDIRYAISVVKRDQKYYSPSVSKYCGNSGIDNEIKKHLTKREREVLNKLAQGMTNEDIAKSLYITKNTVKKHISNILSKLGLENRSQVVYYVNNV